MVQWIFKGPDFTSPERLVASFVADYQTWSETTFAAMAPFKHQTCSRAFSDLIIEASDAYERFLAPFLAEGVILQGIAFGGPCMFHSSGLRILEQQAIRDGIEIRFSIHDTHPGHTRIPVPDEAFVATLAPAQDGTLKLKQVWRIDPCLKEGWNRTPCL